MQFYLVLVSAAAFAVTSWAKPSDISDAVIIKAINSKQSTWKADFNTQDIPIEHRIGFLGIHQDPNFQVETKVHKIGRTTIPETFDARTQWPECEDVISNIRDQGNCGSCWAFSSAEVMSDRLCIQTKGAVKFEFSPEELVSCCSNCGYGCGGGFTYRAWDYWIKQGIVSGGDYNSQKGCQPYEELAYLNNTTPQCQNSCQNNNYNKAYKEDKKYGSSYYHLQNDVQQIQTEIMTNGPVQASYYVYRDFTYYKEGVYVRTSDEQLGGHAVKIVGWGTENRTPYWLVANSWGSNWANYKGFFKIRRGTNECGFEDRVYAGSADLATRHPDDDPVPGAGSPIKLWTSAFGLFLSSLLISLRNL